MASRKNFEFTHNNYTEEDISKILSWKCQYVVIGEEIAPTTGTPHLQGYVEFHSSVKWKTVTNKKNKDYGWIDGWMNTSEKRCPITYCKKDGKFHEAGTPKQQGKRNDLIELKDQILNNGLKVDDIAISQPFTYHAYGRTLNKIEDLAMRKKYRNFMTKGIWYWGPTGVGKSHAAYENFTPDTHYDMPDDKGWYDGYTQQETVILNDFRGHLKYEYLLKLVDKWPITLSRRGREPMPFMSKTVIVTSSLSPEQVYHRRHAEDDLKQFYERFTVIHMDGESKRNPVRTEEKTAEVVVSNNNPTTAAEEEFKLDEELEEFLRQ